MDDKMFQLMEKMYLEIQNLKHGQDHIKSEISEMKTDIKKLGSKIDVDLTVKSEALLDGYKQNTEKLEIIDDKVDRLRIDVNNISMKTEYNDNRLIEITRNLKKAK
jgi:predicted  nucleic acid-binding Zn-ribbon protein